MEKRITAFVRSSKSDTEEINVIQIQVTLPEPENKVSAEFDFLAGLGFKFNQIEADYLDAELETPDYSKAMETLKSLRAAGYSFDDTPVSGTD